MRAKSFSGPTCFMASGSNATINYAYELSSTWKMNGSTVPKSLTYFKNGRKAFL